MLIPMVIVVHSVLLFIPMFKTNGSTNSNAVSHSGAYNLNYNYK